MQRTELKTVNSPTLRTLEEWLQRTSITLTQVNGQRKYGGPPPDWRGPTPGPGCEVFINQIPRNFYEDKLIPLFQSVAPLYEFRLMMNFSGQNRGFAYAQYGDADGAAAAIRALHKYPLHPGFPLLVSISTEKRQLCLGDLPPSIERRELHTVLCQISEGVDGVNLKTNGQAGKNVSAVVYYTSHYAASMAKKHLVHAFKKLYSVTITVRWISYNQKSRREGWNEEAPLTPPNSRPLKIGFTPPQYQLTRDPLPPPSPSDSPPLIHRDVSRAVGGPALQAKGAVPPQNPQNTAEPFDDIAVQQLYWVCNLLGLGAPLFDIEYHHTGPNATLYFTYKVKVPGLPMPLRSMVHIPSGTNIEAEVHQAIAMQLLKAIHRAQMQ